MHGNGSTRFQPTRIAHETFLVHDHQGEGTAPVCVALNSMVIRAAQPVVIDTGVAANRERYLADVFGLVEPEDVRWVFLSHDDVDHTGNVNELMARCPQRDAGPQLVHGRADGRARSRWRRAASGGWATARRFPSATACCRPSAHRSSTRRRRAGCTTRRRGVYWASDAFAAPMPVPVRSAAELDEVAWIDGMAMFDHYVSPWLALVDDARFQTTVDRVAALAPTVLAGCHTPVIAGDRVGAAIAAARLLPGRTVPPQPDQAVLEEIQRLLAQAA